MAMQKSKKILGLLGFAGVMAMTTVAIFEPNRSVLAQEGAVNVQVNVVNNNIPAIEIKAPQDNQSSLNPNTPVKVAYTNGNYAKRKLFYKPANGPQQIIALPSVIKPASADKTWQDDLSLILSTYGYGSYVFETKLGDGTSDDDFVFKLEDTVRFNYLPAMPTAPVSENNENNPVISVSYNDDVCSISIQAFEKGKNNPLLNPPFIFNIPTPRPAGNISDIVIPFVSYGMPAGDYRFEITPRACDSNNTEIPNGKSETHINGYNPPAAIDVPNTGYFTIAGINIVKSDLIATAVISASLIGLFGLFATRKKSKSRR